MTVLPCFFQDKNATDILDHMMRQCLEEGRELLPNRSNLMLKLCLKLSRPSNQEVDRLFAALQSTHEPGCNLIRLFEILCCQNIELLTRSGHFFRILSFDNKVTTDSRIDGNMPLERRLFPYSHSYEAVKLLKGLLSC